MKNTTFSAMLQTEQQTALQAIFAICNNRPLWAFSCKNKTITTLVDKPVASRLQVSYGYQKDGFRVTIDIENKHFVFVGCIAWDFVKQLNTSNVGIFGCEHALQIAAKYRAVKQQRGGAK